MRTVQCSKYHEDLPGLERAPFSGELGTEIFNRVSARAWKEWQDDMMIKVINEYRLNMADPEHYQRLLQQMRAFLGLSSDATVVEVENADRGRGS